MNADFMASKPSQLSPPPASHFAWAVEEWWRNGKLACCFVAFLVGLIKACWISTSALLMLHWGAKEPAGTTRGVRVTPSPRGSIWQVRGRGAFNPEGASP